MAAALTTPCAATMLGKKTRRFSSRDARESSHMASSPCAPRFCSPGVSKRGGAPRCAAALGSRGTCHLGPPREPAEGPNRPCSHEVTLLVPRGQRLPQQHLTRRRPVEGLPRKPLWTATAGRWARKTRSQPRWIAATERGCWSVAPTRPACRTPLGRLPPSAPFRSPKTRRGLGASPLPPCAAASPRERRRCVPPRALGCAGQLLGQVL